MADRESTGGAGGTDRSRQQGSGRADEGFGDDAGTRVGRPDSAGTRAEPSTGTGVPVGEEGSILEGEESRRGMTASDRAGTGAGAEGAEGIHGAKGRDPKEKSSVEHVEHAHGEPGRGEGAGLSGSEPLRHRETEHQSGYGGKGAEPKTSSDDR